MKDYKIFYLHGFGSSPDSLKASLIKERYGDHMIAINLTGSPMIAMEKMKNEIINQTGNDIVLIGSSLGAFYSAYLGAIFDLPVILINPPLEPWKTIPNFDPDYPNEWKLQLQEIKELTSNADLLETFVTVFLGSEDEHLDYSKALNYYFGSKIIVKSDNHKFEKYIGVAIDEIELQLKFIKTLR